MRLDLKRLTVVADTDDGPLSLAQMGSGENWVGYHVAAHLSLHKLFFRRERPVPGLLMLDQPSQAHYPPERDEGGRIDELPDEDQAAVRQLFTLLFHYCDVLSPDMQIIRRRSRRIARRLVQGTQYPSGGATALRLFPNRGCEIEARQNKLVHSPATKYYRRA